MRGRAHSDEVKAQVMAALLAGQGVTEIASQWNLPHSTVVGWKDEAGIKSDELRRKKGERVDALVFAYLTANLTALKKQADVAAEEDYIRKQPANELAVLHGVMADKGIRLLESLTRAEASRPAEDA